MEGEKRNVWTKGGVWAQKDVFEFLRVDLCPLSCVRGRNCCAWLAACVYLWVSVCERLKRVAGGVCYQHSAVGVWGGQGWDEGRNWKGRIGGVCPVGGSRSRDTSLQYTHSLLLLTSRALTHTHTAESEWAEFTHKEKAMIFPHGHEWFYDVTKPFTVHWFYMRNT